MDNKIQMIKWSVRISIGIDIFLAICFVIGFVLASMKVGDWLIPMGYYRLLWSLYSCD